MAEPASAPLEAERDRLLTALRHLRRSQRELAEALRDAPDDADFKDAISENEQVIAKYVKTVAELNAAIGKAGGKVVLEVLGAADAERGAAAGADAAGADPAGDGAASRAGRGGEQSEEGQWI